MTPDTQAVISAQKLQALGWKAQKGTDGRWRFVHVEWDIATPWRSSVLGAMLPALFQSKLREGVTR